MLPSRVSMLRIIARDHSERASAVVRPRLQRGEWLSDYRLRRSFRPRASDCPGPRPARDLPEYPSCAFADHFLRSLSPTSTQAKIRARRGERRKVWFEALRWQVL